MSNTAITLVLAGALALAIYNVLSRYFQRGDWEDRSALTTALSMGGASLALFIYSFATGGPQLSPDWLFPVSATGFLNIGIMFARTRARALEEVSLVTPIDSTTPAVVILTAMIFIGEYPTNLGWLGIWVLVVGTYILNIQDLIQQRKTGCGGSSWREKAVVYLAPFLILRKSAGVRWAFVAAGLSALSVPFDGLAARRADVGFGFGIVFAIAALGNFVLVVALKEHRRFKCAEALWRMVALGVPFAIGTILVGLAFQISLVAYVGTMKRVMIPMTIILSYSILGEKKSFASRIIGGIIMTVGAVIIALAE